MFKPWQLGNDVVDLADPRHAGKAGDTRFLKRVFSEAEAEAILSSPHPDRELWAHWAGKEAAFKTVSKALGSPPVFNHPRFQVSLSGMQVLGGDPPATNFGEVRYGEFLLPLRVEVSGRALHAVSWIPGHPETTPPFSWGFTTIDGEEEGWRDRLRPRFSAREWACISHRPSALARLAARRSLASALSVKEPDLELGCDPGHPGRRIPRVLLKGKDVEVDLSLSHHGRLLAWAFLIS